MGLKGIIIIGLMTFAYVIQILPTVSRYASGNFWTVMAAIIIFFVVLKGQYNIRKNGTGYLISHIHQEFLPPILYTGLITYIYMESRPIRTSIDYYYYGNAYVVLLCFIPLLIGGICIIAMMHHYVTLGDPRYAIPSYSQHDDDSGDHNEGRTITTDTTFNDETSGFGFSDPPKKKSVRKDSKLGTSIGYANSAREAKRNAELDHYCKEKLHGDK
jgi:hypothetical protein